MTPHGPISPHNDFRWSLGFGHWWGVPVRLHVLMLLFAAVAAGVTIDGSLEVAPLTAAILLASVVLHEAGHSLAAIRMGGQVDAVVLAPFGGMKSPRVPNEPEPQLIASVSGPMVNLGVVILAVIALAVIKTPTEHLLPLLNPIRPDGVTEGSLGVIALKQTLWINWTLFLVNLIPAYPFDMAPAMRAALWPVLGRRTALISTAYLGQAVAVMLIALAFAAPTPEPAPTLPLWAPLVSMAVVVFFGARRDLAMADHDDALTSPILALPEAGGQDLLGGDWYEDQYEKVLVEQAADAKSERRRQQQEADEAYEDARVDDILARLHSRGFEDLSAEDRAILHRASRRYRDRRVDD